MFFIFRNTKNYNYKSNEGIKSIRLLIIFCIYFGFVIIDNYKTIHLEPIYKKIKEFESSHIKNFIYQFFIEDELSKIKKFRKINLKDELSENIIIEGNKKKETPEISVIITLYNQVNCFFKALRSVQNQSLKNIEIIIVDDCSTDNTLEKLEKYQKEDDRIILLKHLYNYGTIKSRSDAIKLAKGKYITILDGDDSFANGDILYNCFHIGKVGYLDVVEFKLAYFKNMHYKLIEKNLDPIENINNRIIYQPELKYKFIKMQENEHLWGFLNRNIVSKLIKNEIFKQVLEFIGKKYTEDYILVFEDTIMSISLFIISNSYYLMKEPGYYRSKGECDINISEKSNKKCGLNNCIISPEFDAIKYLNFLTEKLKNNYIEGGLVFKELLIIDYNIGLYRVINNNFNYIYKILNHLLSKFTLFNHSQKNRIIYIKYQLMKKEENMINQA